MKRTEKWMPASEAKAIMRFFVRIEQQIERAWKEGRDKDACSMARLTGSLHVRIFEMDEAGNWISSSEDIFEQMKREAA